MNARRMRREIGTCNRGAQSGQPLARALDLVAKEAMACHRATWQEEDL
jgi:Flp pilus assembly protein TadB